MQLMYTFLKLKQRTANLNLNLIVDLSSVSERLDAPGYIYLLIITALCQKHAQHSRHTLRPKPFITPQTRHSGTSRGILVEWLSE